MGRKFVVLVLVFFLVLGAFSTAVFYDQGKITRARASSQCEPVAEKSFLVSLPKEVPSGGSCEVNVFARCADESAAVGKQVTLGLSNGTTRPEQALTDESGKAAFAVTGQSLVSISAQVGNLILPQTVTCNFH